jgi:hypothetical protein
MALGNRSSYIDFLLLQLVILPVTMESFSFPPASQTYASVHFQFMVPKSHNVLYFHSEEVLAYVSHSTKSIDFASLPSSCIKYIS